MSTCSAVQVLSNVDPTSGLIYRLPLTIVFFSFDAIFPLVDKYDLMNFPKIKNGELINLVIIKNENNLENNVEDRIVNISMNNKINIKYIVGELLIYDFSDEEMDCNITLEKLYSERIWIIHTEFLMKVKELFKSYYNFVSLSTNEYPNRICFPILSL